MCFPKLKVVSPANTTVESLLLSHIMNYNKSYNALNTIVISFYERVRKHNLLFQNNVGVCVCVCQERLSSPDACPR